MIGGPEQWGGQRRCLCEGIMSANVQDKSYPWQSVYSDKYVFSVSEGIEQFTTHVHSPCTILYDDDVCPRLHPLDNECWIGDLSKCSRKKIIHEGTLK